MNLGQMLFNGKCKVFAPFYYIPMEIGIKYFLQGNFSVKIINIMKKYLLLFSLTIFLFACNKDEEISQDVVVPPVIELDSEDGIYVVKIGKEIVIEPTYQNVDYAVYSWKCNGRIISDEPQLKYIFNECGSYYVTLRVDTRDASTEEEIRVDVNELAPPVISLVTPSIGLKVVAGREYILTPDIQNAEGATYLWTLNGNEVGTENTYTFKQDELGTYELTLTVANEDGQSEKTVSIEVVDKLPIEIVVPSSLYFTEDNTKYVELGRTLFVRPFVSISAEPSYQWSLDGQPIEGANSLVYGFKPAKTGEHTLTFTVKYDNQRTKATLTRNIAVSGVDEVSVNIPVKCCEAAGKRPFAAGNSIYSNKVYEFVPAPGQFVNETNTAGFNGESTHEAACAYAQKRLDNEQYVSLGGWGGYIVVGFDHSIENKGGYDFSIKGNAFDSSNEPGIVWVMQDVNGDGLPNDEWYELKGSEYGKPETIQDYAVTYFRPGPNMDTQWQDNKGNKGAIDRLGNYHPQEFYYPLWIEEDSYTLYGTCLKARTEQSPSTGMWSNNPFGWGYADNIGDDMPNKDNPNAGALGNYFKISDAVNIDGTSANLSHIDFIKVQTGVNVKAGWLGENSTEVFKFCDENNNNDK